MLICSSRDVPSDLQLLQLSFRSAGQIFEASDVSVGGVLLPDAAREKPIAGEVVSVGPGKREKDGTRKAPQVRHVMVATVHPKRGRALRLYCGPEVCWRPSRKSLHNRMLHDLPQAVSHTDCKTSIDAAAAWKSLNAAGWAATFVLQLACGMPPQFIRHVGEGGRPGSLLQMGRRLYGDD